MERALAVADFADGPARKLVERLVHLLYELVHVENPAIHFKDWVFGHAFAVFFARAVGIYPDQAAGSRSLCIIAAVDLNPLILGSGRDSGEGRIRRQSVA